MKRFLSLIALGAIGLAATDAASQTRDLGAQRLILDNGAGTGSATLQYTGIGHVIVSFPPFPSTTVAYGTVNGQTLAWDHPNGEWDLMNNWMNDGSTLAATSPITLDNVGGGNVTTLTENGMSRSVTGDLVMNVGPSSAEAAVLRTNGILHAVGSSRPSGGMTDGFIAGFDVVGNVGIELVSTGAGPRQAYIDFTRNGATDFDARIINTGDNELMIDGANLSMGGNGILNVSTLNTSGVVTHTNLSANMPVKTNGSDELISAAINLASTDVTGVLPVANGGTGGGAFAANRVIVSDGTGTSLVANSAGTADQLLHGDLSWGAVNLASAQVTGILPDANIDALIARDAEVTSAINTAVNGTAGNLAVFTGTNAVGNGNLSGDVTTAGGTATTIANNAVTSAKILDDQITNADINSAAGIVDTKLATISTAGKVANSATTATSANTPNTIVLRDGAGNFSAGTITAALSGNATTATTATNFSGSLSGDVTGTQGATTVVSVQNAAGTSIVSAINAQANDIIAANIPNLENLNGTLDVANGGTGLTTVTANGLLVGNGAGAMTVLAPGSNGQVLTMTAGAPAWAAAGSGGSGNFLGHSTINVSGVSQTITTAQLNAAGYIAITRSGIFTTTVTLGNGSVAGQVVHVYRPAGTNSWELNDNDGTVELNPDGDNTMSTGEMISLFWDGSTWRQTYTTTLP